MSPERPLEVGGRLLLVGAGKMGGAMLEGWLGLGLDPARLAALDPHPPAETADLIARNNSTLNPELGTLGPQAVVLLAVKPQMMADALPRLAPSFGPSTLAISIMAGKTLASIASFLPPGSAIVRAMPNTPAAIGRGITVAVANAAVSAPQRAVADALLRSAGAVEWVDDEALIDAVTAVSGSGPAYVFHLVEALAEAGIAAGLPEGLAQRLARETVSGSGELLHRSSLAPAALRQNVTSPGGTTAAALEILMAGDDGLAALMTRAVAAAKRRAGELAG
jgi:pyrroline-5-carboxylate reductase